MDIKSLPKGWFPVLICGFVGSPLSSGQNLACDWNGNTLEQHYCGCPPRQKMACDWNGNTLEQLLSATLLIP